MFNIYKRVLNYDIHDGQQLQRFVKGQRTIPETFKERGFQSKVSFSVGLHDDASLEQNGRRQTNLCSQHHSNGLINFSGVHSCLPSR